MAKSFIPVASEHHFPIQNIPFGTGIKPGDSLPRCVSRLGDFAVDLKELENQGFFADVLPHPVFQGSFLNDFMSLSRTQWVGVRGKLQHLLSEDTPTLRDNQELRQAVLVPIENFTSTLPVQIGDYTDFYASKNHAFNVGSMFRGPENALQPNWTRLPVGYHGRASSIVISGHPVRRPRGQVKPPDASEPLFTASKRVDYELEMAFFVGGKVNELGETIDVNEARESIFGLALLNDWSARDLQAWEYVPLGPFNAKNFISTISPWIVTLEALEPFKQSLPAQDPQPLPYLNETDHSSYNIRLDSLIKTPSMEAPHKISESNMLYLYWSITQQLAHHTESGCNLRVGDMMGTGTISGPDQSSLGCLLELTWAGKNPIELPSGEKRTFLEDGDELILTGACTGEGYTIGFGEVVSKVTPALQDKYFHN